MDPVHRTDSKTVEDRQDRNKCMLFAAVLVLLVAAGCNVNLTEHTRFKVASIFFSALAMLLAVGLLVTRNACVLKTVRLMCVGCCFIVVLVNALLLYELKGHYSPAPIVLMACVVVGGTLAFLGSTLGRGRVKRRYSLPMNDPVEKPTYNNSPAVTPLRNHTTEQRGSCESEQIVTCGCSRD